MLTRPTRASSITSSPETPRSPSPAKPLPLDARESSPGLSGVRSKSTPSAADVKWSCAASLRTSIIIGDGPTHEFVRSQQQHRLAQVDTSNLATHLTGVNGHAMRAFL